MPEEQRWGVFTIALAFVSGFLFTNLSFDLMAASIVETIKTSQTVSSMLLSVLWAAASTDPMPSILELLCMVPIVAGRPYSNINHFVHHIFWIHIDQSIMYISVSLSLSDWLSVCVSVPFIFLLCLCPLWISHHRVTFCFFLTCRAIYALK